MGSTTRASTATCPTWRRWRASEARNAPLQCVVSTSCYNRNRMNQVYKNLALFMVIGLIVILLFPVFSTSQQGGQESPIFSELLRHVGLGRIGSVTNGHGRGT